MTKSTAKSNLDVHVQLHMWSATKVKLNWMGEGFLLGLCIDKKLVIRYRNTGVRVRCISVTFFSVLILGILS